MYCSITAGACIGVQAYLVGVEVDVSRGLPGFSMVGSLSGEVRESRDRVRVALKNVGVELPPMHITVNLSPADRQKEGTAFDLPIAVGMLQAFRRFHHTATENTLFLGELGLAGEVKPVRGVLPIVQEAAKQGIKQCIVPKDNALEAAVIPGICVRGVRHIRQLIDFLCAKDTALQEQLLERTQLDVGELFADEAVVVPDFGQVYGQDMAKRAAEIAAAGFHNLLLIGPPGTGKSMIAKCIPGILPPLTLEESLEVTSVMSVAGTLGNRPLMTKRPFQSPHQTISQAALIGGNRIPSPGVISLAHRGVLFLDELPQFQRTTIDSLRQPLEEHQIQISRTQGNVSYPADFMLVCAMNPCPCGYYPDQNRCKCRQSQVDAYVGKVSGPILDRMDLAVTLQPLVFDEWDRRCLQENESSERIRARILVARKAQKARFAGSNKRFNADMDVQDVEKFCTLGEREKECVRLFYKNMQLSMRGYHRMLKVARTIADLDAQEKIKEEHLVEAACFRMVQE